MVTGVTMEEKCLEISHYVSVSANILSYSDEEKFLMVERTIFFMESVLGEEAAKYKALGYYCLHRGCYQQKTKKLLLEALRSFEEAVSHFDQAKDWENPKEKFEAMKMIID